MIAVMPFYKSIIIIKIMTTRQTGGLHKGYKPKGYRPASKGAGFHSVQAQPLTRRYPLRDIC
ncbi:hypothetical protein, partial [Peptostreptococcus porci]|uniref:hypothetical protein n=1 Tax=Peptostreptococcus porci TaxID=2652282 RepID=UPI0023F3B6D8